MFPIFAPVFLNNQIGSGTHHEKRLFAEKWHLCFSKNGCGFLQASLVLELLQRSSLRETSDVSARNLWITAIYFGLWRSIHVHKCTIALLYKWHLWWIVAILLFPDILQRIVQCVTARYPSIRVSKKEKKLAQQHYSTKAHLALSVIHLFFQIFNKKNSLDFLPV